jgi:predicted glycoside hydrolase/deacetylase ChbG (UPF0249 family)
MATSRTLIVNADDFGLSAGVNAGIIAAHQNGIVTSASLMVRQPAARQAAELAANHPELSVGLHIDLCEWIFREDTWHLAYEAVPMNDDAAIEREVLAQLNQFRALTGHIPTHLDSHQHVHRNEPVRSIVLHHADRHALALRGETPGLHYCGAFYGQSNKGELYPKGIAPEHLIDVLRSLPDGVTELGCHPANTLDFKSVYLQERLTELQSLCDPQVRTALERESIRLCGFLDPAVQGLVKATR